VRRNRIPGLAETSLLAGANRALRRFHIVFQSIQVALALVLLSGAGLMANSFFRLILTQPGFETKGLWVVKFSMPPRINRDQARSFYEQLKPLVRSVPGVESATISRGTPAGRGWAGSQMCPEGASGAGALTLEYFVAPDYFSTLRIPIIGGRNFGPEDTQSSQPVAILDARCAARFWPGQSPIGKRLHSDADSCCFTIVGVAAPVKTAAFEDSNSCQLYRPFSNSPIDPSLVIRMGGNPAPVLGQVRSMIATLDPTAKITDSATFDELYAIGDRSAAIAPRFYLILMAIFATVALATAAVGIYGMLSYSVAQRIPEIGVRMSLGATARDIRMLLIGTISVPVGIGIVMGILASFWLTRSLRSLLYEISPNDPATILTVIVFLVLVSLSACLLPCRRAARVDPMTALRVE
jgi:putative ABC transport system permease protein